MKTKSVLLIGLGRFGKYIAMKLHELGHEVMAVDENEERVDDAMPYVTNGQIGDTTNSPLAISKLISSTATIFTSLVPYILETLSSFTYASVISLIRISPVILFLPYQ